MGQFDLVSDFVPKGDQPKAIADILDKFTNGDKFVTLLGATGTGKTYTAAQVIQTLQKPTLVIAPNKTLCAQLYSEFKDLFPHNSVNYFVSYYDYYQPEAYMPSSGRYIEKDFSINEEIDRLRMTSAHAVLTRQDVIVCATVSCIYGLGDPTEWKTQSINIAVGDSIDRNALIRKLIDIQYERNDIDFHRGTIRVRGDTMDVWPGYLETAIRVEFYGDEVERIAEVDALRGEIIAEIPTCRFFPARHFVIPEDKKMRALELIEEEMREQVEYFKERQMWAEAERIEQRTMFDLEMMRELGYCHGIENYSRPLDGRAAGTPPMTLTDYFPEDFLLIIDESHISVPQIGGMVEGDKSRKKNLVDYGFRLPSAYDNRPLTWAEFEDHIHHCLFMSATPAVFEITHSNGVAEQIIRPTGLVDPEVEVRPTRNQIDDLLAEIKQTVARGFRTLVTTLTKRLAENIAEYFAEQGIRVRYLHSEVETIERMELLRGLRQGEFDVLVGINLLREGLDLPEVALVAILDGDKESFLRDARSLIQTIGRASRNSEGRAIIYADTVTRSIRAAVDETNRRRAIQVAFNEQYGISPTTIQKAVAASLAVERPAAELEDERFLEKLKQKVEAEVEAQAEAEVGGIDALVAELEAEMRKAAEELKFERAAFLRDKIKELRGEV
ncbi:MAG TPA: excinuclease ABC subunit UvrB [Candidatus Lokiarchaeia archaeon]|nr:excinuclease ABC subunit UvrB [Candidatus Lokiarchaeia archaeon]